MKDPALEFRPHHFLCTLGFEGKGYSDEFVKNFSDIASTLRDTGACGDEIPIRVVGGTDRICAPCPNREGDFCSTETKIASLDRAHAKVLELRTGDTLTWGEAKRRIMDKMTPEKFHQACAPCSWRSLGVCERALLRLRRGAHSDDSVSN